MTNFPNLFTFGGPGSATGHNSHVFQEESQAAYAMDALRLMRARRISSVEVRAEEQRTYVGQHTARLAGTVWSVGGCTNFYQGADGVASVNWPAPTSRVPAGDPPLRSRPLPTAHRWGAGLTAQGAPRELSRHAKVIAHHRQTSVIGLRRPRQPPVPGRGRRRHPVPPNPTQSRGISTTDRSHS